MNNDRCYKPFSMKVEGIHIIVYLLKDENSFENIFDRKNKNTVVEHIRTLYHKNKDLLKTGLYHIVFLWNLENNPMTDVWIHYTNTIAAPSGPLQRVYTFRHFEQFDIEISSGDTLIILASEELLRRETTNLEEYLDRKRYFPSFPFTMKPKQDFFS